MENVLFNGNLKEIQENIEKYKQIFLNTKENTNFITKDGIKFELDANYYEKIKLIFEKNDLNLANISV